jgi:hypothetical protein
MLTAVTHRVDFRSQTDNRNVSDQDSIEKQIFGTFYAMQIAPTAKFRKHE